MMAKVTWNHIKQRTFNIFFYPIFTPTWNLCTYWIFIWLKLLYYYLHFEVQPKICFEHFNLYPWENGDGLDCGPTQFGFESPIFIYSEGLYADNLQSLGAHHSHGFGFLLSLSCFSISMFLVDKSYKKYYLSSVQFSMGLFKSSWTLCTPLVLLLVSLP